MKNGLRIVFIAGAAVFIAAVAYFAWSNFFGTALENRVRESGAAANSARAAAGRINSISKKAKTMPGSWANLSFDEMAETTRILDDSGSNRGYKVDALRDPSASKIQKDLITIETELVSAIGDAKKSIRQIDKVSWYLPADRAKDSKAAKNEAERSIKAGEQLVKNVKELKYDIDIWGFLAVSLEINKALMVSFDKASADLAAGDYASVSKVSFEILNGVNESVTWLQFGKQELTNISVYSKDSDDILSFISDAKTTAEAFNNAATAGTRANAEQLEMNRQRADSQLNKLKKAALKNSVGTDFITWFRANAERRL